MNSAKLILSLCFILLIAGSVLAQTDKYGKVDTIYAEPYQIDAKNWGVNVSLYNDEDIIAISLPLKLMSGRTRIVADSVIFIGGRVENFRVKNARVDTTIQCVTLGLINDIGVSVPPLAPGEGRIATIFVSGLDGDDIKSLEVDTTTTKPGNTMQMVTPPVEEVIPVFKVVEPAKAEKK
jgi:hypothetical protein